MKTFFNLVQDVQKKGLCHRCGGCAAFCTAINYGALKINSDGKPIYADMEKCIECGLCYSICPETNDLEEDTRRKAAWSEPMGRVIETTVVRASVALVREKATDGGAVTALLLHLFDRNRIDGAIVTRPVGKFQREPHLATTREEILNSAGLFLDTSHGMQQFSEQYMTYASIQEFDPMVRKKLSRVALVGTPCQIKSIRKMQVINLVPSDAIKFCFGLFCSGNFIFGETERQKLAKAGNFSWEDAVKINLKDQLMVTLKSGEGKSIFMEEMAAIKRYACTFCQDYSAEFADISFGGMGAQKGWTTVITRTPLGRAILADARNDKALEQFSIKDDGEFATKALQAVRRASAHEKKEARHARYDMQKRPVRVSI